MVKLHIHVLNIVNCEHGHYLNNIIFIHYLHTIYKFSKGTECFRKMVLLDRSFHILAFFSSSVLS